MVNIFLLEKTSGTTGLEMSRQGSFKVNRTVPCEDVLHKFLLLLGHTLWFLLRNSLSVTLW